MLDDPDLRYDYESFHNMLLEESSKICREKPNLNVLGVSALIAAPIANIITGIYKICRGDRTLSTVVMIPLAIPPFAYGLQQL